MSKFFQEKLKKVLTKVSNGDIILNVDERNQKTEKMRGCVKQCFIRTFLLLRIDPFLLALCDA